MTARESPEKLRVLHVYRTYFPDTQGGGEELIRQIALNTATLGIDNRVFTLSPNPAATALERPEATVIQASRHLEIASCGFSFNALGAFRDQAAWADILHYHFPWPFGDLLHLLSGQCEKKPTVVSYLSDIVRQRALFFFYYPLMRAFFKRVDRIVATSPNYCANSLLLQRHADKVCVIPIGLSDDTPPACPELTAQYRRQYGDNFLLFLGVLRYYKGLDYLVEAARETRAQIVIAGSGPQESTLKNRCMALGLDNIHFVGHISDRQKAAILNACRAFVFPSHLPAESFGISLLEASMAGKPMISCEIGTGTSFVNLHQVTGLVVPPANPESLAKAMNTLAENVELAQSFGQSAKQRYRELFTGIQMGREYSRLYSRLLWEHREQVDR